MLLQKREAHVSSWPVTLHIDVTDRCDLRCVFCQNAERRSGARGGRLMTFDEYTSIIDTLSPFLMSVKFGDKSEPLMHPKIVDMVRYAKMAGTQCCLVTNLHSLDERRARGLVEAGVDRVRAGIDGIDQKTYSHYRRGGDFSKVMNNLATLIRFKTAARKTTPEIIWQYVIFKHNEQHMPAAKAMARDLGIKIDFIHASLYDLEHTWRDWLPRNQKNTRYCLDSFPANGAPHGRVREHRPRPFCNEPWLATCIDAYGNVFPCCGEHRPDYVVGNVFTTPFQKIWNSRKLRATRDYLAGKTVTGVVQCNDCLSVGRIP